MVRAGTGKALGRRAPRKPRRAQKSGYHHGSLRRALLDAALALIERHGTEGFTLRAAAREAGVTPGAPYHHFPDKDALVTALAGEGFELLHSFLARAREAHEDAVERAQEMAVAYVRFAAEHPTHFRVMVSRDVRRAFENAELARTAWSAYELMRTAVVDRWGEGVPPGAADEIVLGSWSIVHGLAFLAMDGHIEPKGSTWGEYEPMVRRTLARLAWSST